MRLLLGCMGIGSCILVTAAWISGLVGSPIELYSVGSGVALDHGTLGRWALRAAIVFNVAVSLYYLGIAVWVRQKTHPVRLPETWAIEARRRALWCLPLAGLSLLTLAIAWSSGTAAAVRTAQQLPSDNITRLHWVFSTLAVAATLGAFARYRQVYHELTQVVSQVRNELNRIGKA